MRQIITIGLLTILAIELNGQIVGKVLINDQPFVDGSLEQAYFDFRPSTAKLSKAGKKYLDAFAMQYLLTAKTGDSLRIVLDPAETPDEREILNNQIGLTRAESAYYYLKDKFGIEVQKATVRQVVKVCELTGTLVTDNKSNGRRRKKS